MMIQHSRQTIEIAAWKGRDKILHDRISQGDDGNARSMQAWQMAGAVEDAHEAKHQAVSHIEHLDSSDRCPTDRLDCVGEHQASLGGTVMAALCCRVGQTGAPCHFTVEHRVVEIAVTRCVEIGSPR